MQKGLVVWSASGYPPLDFPDRAVFNFVAAATGHPGQRSDAVPGDGTDELAIVHLLFDTSVIVQQRIVDIAWPVARCAQRTTTAGHNGHDVIGE